MKPNASDPGRGQARFGRLCLLVLGWGFFAGVPDANAGIFSTEETGSGTAPACADVVRMRGEWREDGGRVIWNTAANWGTAGFRVYRRDPESGAEICLNKTLLPVAIQNPAQAYEVVDPAAAAGETGTYRLEETEISGGVRDLGVYTVEFILPPSAPVSRAAKSAVQPRSSPPAGSSSVLKVLLREEGIYGVDLAAIAAGMDLEVEEVQALAAAGSLALECQGQPVPTLFDAVRDRLVFFGRPSTNWYARDAAYLLRSGPGPALPRRAPGAASGAAVLPTRVRYEQDVLPFIAAMQRPADYYYWNAVISTTNPASNRVDFALGLDGYAGGAVTLRVDLQGWTKTTSRNPDHRAEFTFNGTSAGTITFDDQNVATAVLAIADGVASNGTNVLTVRGVLTNATDYSYFVVDGITAEYDRSLAPGAGVAIVCATGAAAVSAAAFTEPLVLALDAASNATWIADAAGALPDKAWAVETNDERLAVIEAAEVPLLDPVPAAADAWFLAETNRIDYLVVASRALEPTAQDLAQLIDQIRQSGAPAVFLESGSNPELAEQVAAETGAQVVEGYPVDMQCELLKEKKLTRYQGFVGIASVFLAAGFEKVLEATETQVIMRYRIPGQPAKG